MIWSIGSSLTSLISVKSPRVISGTLSSYTVKVAIKSVVEISAYVTLTVFAIPRFGIVIVYFAIFIHVGTIEIKYGVRRHDRILHVSKPCERLHGTRINHSVVNIGVVDIDPNDFPKHDIVATGLAGTTSGKSIVFQ